jgi:thiol-disulfide isomerase/thioredoxin
MLSTKPNQKIVYSALIALGLAGFTCRAAEALKVGDATPDLGAYHLEGKLPDNIKGQVVMLDFWASWCPPCKESFPVMEKLHKEHSGEGLVIIAVSVDAKAADMEKFLKKTPATFCILRDAKQELVKTTDPSTMPNSFLIDRAGKVRFVHSGFQGKATAKQYQDEVVLLLKEKAP